LVPTNKGISNFRESIPLSIEIPTLRKQLLYENFAFFSFKIFGIIWLSTTFGDTSRHLPEATSLDWKISVFSKSQGSATACWWEIEDILGLKRWKNSVGHNLRILRHQLTIFVLHIINPYFSWEKFCWTLGFAKHWDFLF
jgi:hypothetical protein